MSKEVAPSRRELETYIEMGLTQQQMVDEHERRHNIRVARSTIAMALDRHGLVSVNPRKRYRDLIPWVMRPVHRQHRDVKMLRLECRTRAGLPVGEAEERRLYNWRTELAKAGAVVSYHPETPEGFYWVPRERTDMDIIRRPAA